MEAAPAPSSLKEKNVHFPFMIPRMPEKWDILDKFSSKMDQRCLRAFAVLGPLRCLEAAFSSSQITDKEMFQQVLPCFSHMAGLRTMIQAEAPFEPKASAGMIPLSDSASGDSAAAYRFDPESSEQGKADYVLRTMTKKKLEEFKRKHPELNWENPDKEELARRVFRLVPDDDLRCDAILDLKTDGVSQWYVKTRAQLTCYGNQAASANLMKGFAPRPVYLIAIDSSRWRLCILDPMGAITVDSHTVTGFQEFDSQQKLRAVWMKKKDPGLEGYFATVEPWTKTMLQEHLDKVNVFVRQGNSSGVAADKYVVSNLWDDDRLQLWNGRGLQGELLQGTLTLCEGLLRLCCGDRVCHGWTPQKLRIMFGRQHERDINRCLKFESALKEIPRRSLDCTYALEVHTAAVKEMKFMRLTPSAALDKGFMDSIAEVKEFLSTIRRQVSTSSDLLKVGCRYGGREFLEFLDDETRSKIGTAIQHIVVDSDIAAEEDSVNCVKGLVIFAKNLQNMPMLKDCKVLVCDDMANLDLLWHELYLQSYRSLVVFCKKVDEEALSMLNDLKAEVIKVVTVCDNVSLLALTAYLGIKVVDSSASSLLDFVGDAEKIVGCRDEVIVYHQNGVETSHPLRNVLELRVSGAPDHLNDRLECVQMAVAAVNSALTKGVIPGNGIGLLAAVEQLEELELRHPFDADYKAGVCIVKEAFKVIEVLSPAVSGSSRVAGIRVNLFQLSTPLQFSSLLEDGEIDLAESAEATLDKLLRLYRRSASVAVKRQRPSNIEVAAPEKRKRDFEVEP